MKDIYTIPTALELEHLRSNYEYYPATGKIYRNFKNISRECTGYRSGYLSISLGGPRYRVVAGGRVAWYLYHGEWPKDVISYIDMDSKNLKISNISVATKSIVYWKGR